MRYRTKTYIAGDWTGDKDAVDQLYKWNNSNYWGLSFHDAHEITQSADSSRNCSIKASLRARLDISKTFVLRIIIVAVLVTKVLLNMNAIKQYVIT